MKARDTAMEAWRESTATATTASVDMDMDMKDGLPVIKLIVSVVSSCV